MNSLMFQSKRKKDHPHPYLSGNFAPINQERSLTPCSWTGIIPKEFIGGQYVRNGCNPVINEDLSREAHWFDGDGMLSGVSFRRLSEGGMEVQPEFVNKYILTDVYISAVFSPFLKLPILPSIATLVDPLSSIFTIFSSILRTFLLIIFSRLPGSRSDITRISVANTSITYHDGRALALCESGPPMMIALPGLETVGWFNGRRAEGELGGEDGPGFGGQGLSSFMNEWTTAHPHSDPQTGDMVLFHSTFIPPYVHYSVLPSMHKIKSAGKSPVRTRLLNRPVPEISSAKMMHDFGVSSNHTVIMDLPLSLDPLNLLKGRPIVCYDPSYCSRFGVFPRYDPDQIRWFETKACCIFHTANTWDEISTLSGDQVVPIAVNMLVCRLTSGSLVYSAGDIPMPVLPLMAPHEVEEEQCRLYYYRFAISSSKRDIRGVITHQWALSAVPFEFPSLRESRAMSAARFIYGCSVNDTIFRAALGRGVKINSLVKVDVLALIERGKIDPPTPVIGCVDTRSLAEILLSKDPFDPIKVFEMPAGWFAQESRFVPRDGGTSEDDGWILAYVFDESQLDPQGQCPPDSKSELWIIDAKTMANVVARIKLPQRVPYGLHGNWFSEHQILNQRPVNNVLYLSPYDNNQRPLKGFISLWMCLRRLVERVLA
ncbi:MAG: hypothetical protein M1834_003502 [Cirrosporium novae-zelandiae]|nr:MAG: hypothetical protein M1834_003502 [Cirrosporium novae-zelandiae]